MYIERVFNFEIEWFRNFIGELRQEESFNKVKEKETTNKDILNYEQELRRKKEEEIMVFKLIGC